MSTEPIENPVQEKEMQVPLQENNGDGIPEHQEMPTKVEEPETDAELMKV